MDRVTRCILDMATPCRHNWRQHVAKEPVLKKRVPQLPELSAAQREIMEIVWERGELSARELRDIIAKKRNVARNTVRTLLERMESKGWLTHRGEGRTYLYSAALPR